MDETLRELRAALQRGPTGREGFPAEVRHRAVAWARRRQGGGAPLRTVASELGVSHETLRRWAKHGVSTFRRVRVSEPSRPPSSTAILLRLRDGIAVEGLSVEDVAALVRALS